MATARSNSGSGGGLFDGSFRARPAVSLRGQSKREESKEDLVAKAAQVRARLHVTICVGGG
jgi:hypothetical protein